MKRGEEKETLRQIVEKAAIETIDKVNKINYFDYVKPTTHDEAIAYTEELLLMYSSLVQYEDNEKEFFSSIMCDDQRPLEYFTRHVDKMAEMPYYQERLYRYIRTRAVTSRIEKALQKIRLKKGYYIIEARYLSADYYGGEPPTWTVIAEDLAGQYGFSDRLNEKTVRTQKNKMLDEIAKSLFDM